MQALQPENGPHPSGAYVPGIQAGGLVFVSGQGPFDPGTGDLVAEDLEGQVRATLANVERVVQSAGGSLHDVVRVDAFLADLSDFDEYDRVYRDAFGGHLPTRTTVEAGLAGIKVEINVIAYVEET